MYISETMPGVLRQLTNYHLEQIPDLARLPIPDGQVTQRLPVLDQGRKTEVVLLFNAAGTGKTRLILETLCNMWGFYFVAPNLEPPRADDATAADTGMRPNRGSAPRDTYTAYEDLLRFEKSGLADGSWAFRRDRRYRLASTLEVATPHTVLAILEARQAVLDIFRRTSGASPMRWAQMQVSCFVSDPFDVAYRLARLQGITLRAPKASRKLPCFIDEAQHALENRPADLIQEDLLRFIPDAKTSFISGTALKLDVAMRHTLGAFNKDVPVRVFPHAMYVKDMDTFWAVLRRHAWDVLREVFEISRLRRNDPAKQPLFARGGKPLGFAIQFPGQDSNWTAVSSALTQWDMFRVFHPVVAAIAPRFFGRIRWTTFFAEELLQVSSVNSGMLPDQHVQAAADMAARKIKHALKDQIHRIRDTRWVHDLYWTAVDADVFSITKIFADDDTARLISEGFALVDRDVAHGNPNVVRGCLGEPLAVEAVMEYLRDPGGEYERMMHKFFVSLQLDNADQGSIGKLAEYVFASVSSVGPRPLPSSPSQVLTPLFE